MSDLNRRFKEKYMEDVYQIIKDMMFIPEDKFLKVKSECRYIATGSLEVDRPPGVRIIPFNEDFDQDDTDCKHNWKNYIGFTESFQYCTKCDERQEIDEEV